MSLNEVVRLHCPAASQLSRQQWERPNSRLSSDLYLHLDDGSLSFVATPATLGHYLCLSTENGYRQTTAIYHVKQRSTPVAQTPTSPNPPQTRAPTQAGTRPGPRTPTGTRSDLNRPGSSTRNSLATTRQFTTNLTTQPEESGWRGSGFQDGESLLSSRCPSYLKELVVVSVLLVLCLSLLLLTTLYAIRLRCRRRTMPQTDTPTRDRRTPEDQAALRGGEFLSKSSANTPNGGQASGLVCNGTLTGSRDHLPNTPI